MTAQPDLTLVVPAWNEAPRLEPALEKLEVFLSARGLLDGRWEILLVDDGSTDGTADLARRLAPWLRVVEVRPNRGKGFAVRRGVEEARGRRILLSDADFSTPLEEEGGLEARRPEGGIAIGSRALDEGLIGVFQPIHRRLMGKTFNRVVRAATGLPIHDTQCGFKLFDAAAAKRLFGEARVDRFAFDVEILWLARRAGIPVVEVPVVWNNVEASRVRVVRDSARMLADLGRIRWIHRSGR
jgi:dolichyl-phosphate beta-glucosyltransferase